MTTARDKTKIKDLIFAIGDINGNLELLKELLDELEYGQEWPLMKGDKVIFIGNYVDVGPNSREVLLELYDFNKRSECEVVFIRGQSDHRFINLSTGYLTSPNALLTIKSYRNRDSNVIPYRKNQLDVQQIIFDRQWMDDFPCFYETDKFFFCNSGIDPDKKLEDHLMANFLFNKKGQKFITVEKPYEKVIVHGHHFDRFDGKIEINKHRINLHTIPNKTGILSCAVLDDATGKCLDVIKVEKSQPQQQVSAK